MNQMISIAVNDQEVRCISGTSLQMLSRDFRQNYEHDIILAKVNGRLRELSQPVSDGDHVVFITTGERLGINAYKRTVCMVMMKAFEDVLGKEHLNRLVIDNSLDKGLYCYLRSDVTLNEKLLNKVKTEMHRIAKEKLPIIKRNLPMKEVVDLFREKGLEDKVRLFKYRRSSSANVYILDNTVDFFYGYLAPDTSYVRYFDLYLHDDGFVLQLPEEETPEIVDPFDPPEKLSAVLKKTSLWANLMGVNDIADLNEIISSGGFADLVMVQEALQEKEIAEIAGRIIESKKRIVLIAGPSSSGKTTFSHRLSIQLRVGGLKPHPIPVDNYFVNREDTPLGPDGKPDFECLEAVDVARLGRDLQALLKGENVELPVFDFISGKRKDKGEMLQIGPHDILVIEGIHALNDAMTATLDPADKFKIYISALTQLNMDDHSRIATTDGRLIRRMCRDSVKRGNSAAKTLGMWASVRHGEDNNIFPYQEKCDAMFNSSLIYELPILKQYAEPLLFSVTRDQPEYDEAKRLLKIFNYMLGVSSEHIPENSIIREFIGGSYFNVG